MKKNFLMTGAALLFATAVMADVPDGIGSITVHDAQMYAQHNGDVTNLVEREGMKCDFKMVTLDGVSYAYINSNTALVADTWGVQFRYYYSDVETGGLNKIENHIGNGSQTVSAKLSENLNNSLISKVTAFLATGNDDNGFHETNLYDFKAATFNSFDEKNTTVPVINSVTANVVGLSATLVIDGDDTDVFYYIEDAAKGYKTLALSKNVMLDGLAAGNDYSLTVTPVHMISGKSGDSKSVNVSLGAPIEEVIIIPSAEEFTGFFSNNVTYNVEADDVMGDVVKVTLNDGPNYNGINLENVAVLASYGLGNSGGDFSYMHVIAKCPTAQQVRGKFNNSIEVNSMDGDAATGIIAADKWTDIRFDVQGKKKITALAIMPAYNTDVNPKSIYIQKIVINNDATPLVDPVSISNAAQENIESIYAVDGTIFVNSDQAQTINVYSIDGRKVSSVVATEGTTTINGLAKGVYVVNNQKVVVK